MSAQLLKRYLSIQPSNATSTDTYSYRSGQSLLRFDLGNQGILRASDVRLSFDIKFFDSAGTPLGDMANAMNQDIEIDEYLVYQSIIQTLTVSSRAYSERVLERIQNYPHLAKHIIAQLHDPTQCTSQFYHEQGSKGVGATLDDTEVLSSIGAKKSTRKLMLMKTDATKVGATSREVSMRLLSGIFLSDPIPLDMTDGLSVEIELADDSSVLTFAANVPNYNGAYYEISNPRLECPIDLETDQQVAMTRSLPQRTLSFLSYTSIYDVLSSSSTTLVHRLGLRKVLSVLVSFTPTKFQKNYLKRSLGFYNPGIRRLVFFRNAQQYPLQYTIQTGKDASLVVGGTGGMADFRQTSGQIVWNAQSTFGKSTPDVGSSCLQPGTITQSNALGQSPFSVGVSFDEVSSQGVQTLTDNLSVEVVSTRQDPDDPTADTPFAATFFYLTRVDVVQSGGALVSMS